MKKLRAQKKNSHRPARRFGYVLAMLCATMFLFGYNLTSSVVQQCSAQVSAAAPTPRVSGGICSLSCGCRDVCTRWDPLTGRCIRTVRICPPPVSCDPPGTTASLTGMLSSAFYTSLSAAAASIEIDLGTKISLMIRTMFMQLEMLERDMISWWRTMWSYNLLPSLQSMTRQLNVELAMQALMLQSAADAGGELEVNLALQKHAIEDERKLRPGEQVCVAATTVGGQGRAANISRAMRQAWESESVARGLNRIGSSGAGGRIRSEEQRYREYKTLFCDPDSNGGRNDCAAPDPLFYNADVQPAKYLYGQLTIDVLDPKTAKTVETIINNMVGVPSTERYLESVLASDPGRDSFLQRRSYLARYAAVRTVPQMSAGWRMPGSRMGDWVENLRAASGVPPSGISDNPSYREILHAISIDRFNSGKYAAGMITDESKIEMEKLTINAFYLMQLRDYYELLERTALTLAVQVSMRADQGLAELPNVQSAVPLGE